MPPPSSSINEHSEQQKVQEETKQIAIKRDELVKKTEEKKLLMEIETEFLNKLREVEKKFEEGKELVKKTAEKKLLMEKETEFLNKLLEVEKKFEEGKADFEEKVAELLYTRSSRKEMEELVAEYEQKILRYPYDNYEAGCGTANPNPNPNPNCWHVGETLTQPEHVPPAAIEAYDSFIRGCGKNKFYTEAIKSTISLSLDNRKILISILISHGTTMLLNCEKLDDTFRSLRWAVAITILEFGETVFDDHGRLVKLIKRIRGLYGDPTLLMKFYQRRTECNCLTQISSEGRMRVGYCSNCYHPFDFKKLKKCSRCDVVHYCGKECQKSHWHNNHKTFCNDMKSKTVHDWDSLLECLSQQTYVGFIRVWEDIKLSDFVDMLSYYRVRLSKLTERALDRLDNQMNPISNHCHNMDIKL